MIELGLILTSLIALLLVNLRSLRGTIRLLVMTMPFYMLIQWAVGLEAVGKYWFNLLIAIGLFAIWLRFCVDEKLRKEFRFNSLDALVLWFLLYGLVLTIRTSLSESPFTALNGFRTYFFSAFFYFLCRFYVKSGEQFEEVVTTFLKVAVVVSCLLILEFCLLNYSDWSWAAIPGFVGQTGRHFIDDPTFDLSWQGSWGTIRRPVGTLLNPHFTGFLIGLAALMTVPFGFGGTRQPAFLAKVFVWSILVLGVLFSTSRTVVWSVFLITCIFGLVTLARGKRPRVLIALVLVGVGFIGVLYGLGLAEFFVTMLVEREDPYFQSFSSEALKNIDTINPLILLFGRGFELSEFEMMNYGLERNEVQGLRLRDIQDEMLLLHYLDIVGLIGGALFVGQILVGMKRGWHAARREDQRYPWALYRGICLAIPLFLLGAIHLPPSNVVLLVFLYMCLGLVGSLDQVSRNTIPHSIKPLKTERYD